MQINNVIFNTDLEQILHDLSSVTQYYFQKGFRDTGDYIMCQCPFHKNGHERKMSAGIRKDNGMFHCFTCGEVHELPEVVSYCLQEDDILGKVGWNWLLKNYVAVGVEERELLELDFTRGSGNYNRTKYNRGTGDSYSYVSEEELDKYRYIHPYMYERGLTDEIIELFDIGYDASSKTITFPIKDIKGNCLYIARRSISMKWYNYPKGVEKPLYGLYEYFRESWHTEQLPLKDQSEIIICEGMFDCLTCWVYGKRALAMNGLGSPLQFEQLKSLPVRKLILATDNDEWGQKARKRIRKNVPNKIITELLLPDGKKDVNDLTSEEFYNLREIF